MPLSSVGRKRLRPRAMKITDIHTHDLSRRGAIINYDFATPMQPGMIYSAGVHPWDTLSPSADRYIDETRELARSGSITAVGECGLDRLTGAPLDVQSDIFRRQAVIGEEYGLPIILHVVKAFQEITALKKELKPSVPWIIHGFRGKPQLAEELLRHGFYLSLGERYNPMTAEAIPVDRLLAESDESRLSATEIAAGFPHFDPSLADRLFLGDRQQNAAEI